MNPILRNVLAVIAGLIGGSIANMTIIMLSGMIIPPPEGVNVMDAESIKSSMHLFEPKHFIFPFLAHAIGTLLGAFIAAKLGASHNMKLALGVGGFFLLGGIANVFMIPAPAWFCIIDLALAYIPMGILGGRLAVRKAAA